MTHRNSVGCSPLISSTISFSDARGRSHKFSRMAINPHRRRCSHADPSAAQGPKVRRLFAGGKGLRTIGTSPNFSAARRPGSSATLGFRAGVRAMGDGKHLTDCRAEFAPTAAPNLASAKVAPSTTSARPRAAPPRRDRQPRLTRQHCDHSLSEPRRHHYRTRDIAFAIVGR